MSVVSVSCMKWLKTWKSKMEKTKGTTQKSWIAIQRGNCACRFGKVSSYLLYSLHRLAILWRWMPQESCCSGPWWLLEDHQTWNAVGRHPLPMSMRVFPASWAAWPKRSDIGLKGPTTDAWNIESITGMTSCPRKKNGKHNFWIFNIPLVRKKEASYSWPPSERFWSLCSTAISPNFTTIARSLSTVKSPLSIVFSCSKPQEE